MVYTLCARTSALACSAHARKHKELRNFRIIRRKTRGLEGEGREEEREERK
jgi:hypothetical protein